MDLKLILINRAVQWLVGGDLFNFVKDAVASVNGDDTTGEEKRALVLKEVKDFFSDTTVILINIAIEVAVLLLQAKAKEA